MSTTSVAPSLTQKPAETPVLQKKTVSFLVVVSIAALLLLPAIHGRGLAGYDDAYWAHEAKGMVRSGDWWSVRFNGSFTMDHPPLFPWLEACCFKAFGIHDWSAKLPSALSGLATIALIYFLTLELGGDSWLCLLATLVLTSTQFFLKNATHAMTDVTFTFFFTLTIFAYLKGLKKSVYLTLMGLPLAAAVLTRSVVGLLAVGIVIVHLILTRRYKTLFSPWLAGGVALGVALSGGWYWSQYRLHGAELLLSHFRFVYSVAQTNYGSPSRLPVSNYLLALLKYYWPWLPFLIAGLVKQTRAAIKEGDSNAKLLLIWMIVIIAPFSFAQTKIPRYMMPLLPAFSVMAASSLYGLVPATRRRTFFYAACAAGCVAICASLLFPPKARADDIMKLAPIAEANSSPGQRILIYTYEEGRSDYLCQFIWYSNRYAQLADSVNDLAARLLHSENATVIVDKQSYGKLLPLIPGRTTHIVGESEHLICFRVP
jgi:4-amino-4-deoxy-L-arabinose transferase-like glycosyltransferase